MTEFYRSQYPRWNAHEGIVRETIESKVPAESLSKDNLARYRARYGDLKTFPLIRMMIETDGSGNNLYMVSQFGFDKQ